MNFIVNKTKAILSGFMVVFMGGFGIYYLIHSMYPEAPIFLIVAAIFAFLFWQNAATVTVTADAVSRSFLGLGKKTVLWSYRYSGADRSSSYKAWPGQTVPGSAGKLHERIIFPF